MRNYTHIAPAARRLNRSGFTLIELMIVVVIIGILASIAVPKFAEASRGAKEAEAGPLLKQIVTLQERYQAKEGSYAADIALLEGGAWLPTSGEYYDFNLDMAHPTGYCVQASPNTAGTTAGLNAQSMDATGEWYDSGSCS
jgi:prepilin-type N-terminal cleavage/methylation domain-containing protein